MATLKLELKNLSYHRGHEDEPLAQATLYVDDIRTAVVSEGDWGGPTRWKILDATKYGEYSAYCLSLPPHIVTYPGDETGTGVEETISVKMDADVYLDTLLEVADTEKAIKKALKQWELLRSPEFAPRQYAEIDVRAQELASPARAHFLSKYPNAIFASDDVRAFARAMLGLEAE